MAVAQSFLLRNPTSQKRLTMLLLLLVDTSKALWGARDHSSALLFFQFPEMGCLDSGWSLLARNESVGSLRPHLYFSCLPRRVPILSMITNLI